MLSEANRITAEVYCISGNVVSFVLNKSIKNSKQIITIVGNFQHTDHHFFGHEFVLDRVEILGLTDAMLTCPDYYFGEVIIERRLLVTPL